MDGEASRLIGLSRAQADAARDAARALLTSETPRDRAAIARALLAISQAYDRAGPVRRQVRSAQIESEAHSATGSHPRTDPGVRGVGGRRALTLSSSSTRALSYDLGELDLPERIERLLRRLGATTLADVVQLKPSQLLAQLGFGRQSLAHLSSALSIHGLALSPEHDQGRVPRA